MNDEVYPKPLTASETDRRIQILKARARALARPAEIERIDGQTLDVVEFRLAEERYAIEQSAVREVQPLGELTPLPCTPSFVLGIINVRGQILPVIDIKKFFDLPDVGITDLHVVIVINNGEVELGILADSIVGMKSIPISSVQSSLPTLTGIRDSYLKGVTGERIVILDATKILTDPKLVVDEQVES